MRMTTQLSVPSNLSSRSVVAATADFESRRRNLAYLIATYFTNLSYLIWQQQAGTCTAK